MTKGRSLICKSLLLITIGLTGIQLGCILADKVGWKHEDWIQFSQTIGLWITGGVGAWFVWRQNQILSSQNSIMERQLTHEQAILAMQTNREQEELIKTLAKNDFRRARDQRGLVQMMGDGLRRRFPNALQIIVQAYAELLNDEPNLGLLPLTEFLQLMRSYNPGINWPNL